MQRSLSLGRTNCFGYYRFQFKMFNHLPTGPKVLEAAKLFERFEPFERLELFKSFK